MTTIQVRDASLFVKVMGQGYPLLFMHGGPGLDHTSLMPFKALADRFTLIFYDHRCNGRSNGVDVTTMTWENLTADAEALRQSLGCEKWAVLGQSFGGHVALEYALRYPQSVSHLLLLDTGGDVRWSQQNAPEILAKRGYSASVVQAVRRFFAGQVTPREFLPTVMKFASAYNYHNSLWSLIHGLLFEPMPKMRPEPHIFACSQLLPGWTVLGRLHEIQVPTLVFAGRHDFLFPPECQEELAAGIANARLEIIECAGHNPQMERPAETIEIVKSFMAETNQQPVHQHRRINREP